MDPAEGVSNSTDDRKRPPAMGDFLLPAFVVVVGLVVTVITALVFHNQVQERERDALRRETERAAGQIEARLEIYAEELFDMRTLIGSKSPPITRADFRSFAVVFDIPGMQELGFVRVVAAENREAYEAAVRQDGSINGIGYPEFEIHPDSEAPLLFVLDFVEPMAGNEASFGLDFGTNPDLLAAIETARDTGQLTATAPITLAQDFGEQDFGEQKGMVFLLGFYGTPYVPPTEEARRSSFIGLVSAVFRANDMLAGVLGDEPQVTFEIYDVGRSDAEPLQPTELGLLADSGPPPRAALGDDSSPAVATAEIAIGGRRWLVVTEPTPALGLGQDRSSWITLSVGIVMSLLLGGLVASLSYSRHRAENLVELRTSELRRQREELIKTHRELEQLARIDTLTGLANHAEMIERSEAMLADPRSPGPHLGVLFCDIDRFKNINDTWGHAAGDAVLVTVAERIRDCVRAGDTVGRMGGDEILVLLPGVHNIDDVRRIAEKVRQRAAEPIQHSGMTIDVTLSIGATLATTGESVSEMRSRADAAMYEAKKAGRNTVTSV